MDMQLHTKMKSIFKSIAYAELFLVLYFGSLIILMLISYHAGRAASEFELVKAKTSFEAQLEQDREDTKHAIEDIAKGWSEELAECRQ